MRPIVPNKAEKYCDLENLDQKWSDTELSAVFFHSNCRPEEAGDIISGVALD